MRPLSIVSPPSPGRRGEVRGVLPPALITVVFQLFIQHKQLKNFSSVMCNPMNEYL